MSQILDSTLDRQARKALRSRIHQAISDVFESGETPEPLRNASLRDFEIKVLCGVNTYVALTHKSGNPGPDVVISLS